MSFQEGVLAHARHTHAIYVSRGMWVIWTFVHLLKITTAGQVGASKSRPTHIANR